MVTVFIRSDEYLYTTHKRCVINFIINFIFTGALGWHPGRRSLRWADSVHIVQVRDKIGRPGRPTNLVTMFGDIFDMLSMFWHIGPPPESCIHNRKFDVC